MMRRDAVFILTGVAHVWTLVVALGLLVVPVTQGVSTVVTTDGVVSESTRVSSMLVGDNGLIVIPLLLAPVALTALALLAALFTGVGFARRKVLLWVSAVLLLGFCAVAIASIGLFYLPAAVALIVSAVKGSRRTIVSEA